MPQNEDAELIKSEKNKFSIAWGYPKRDSKITIFEIEFYGWWFLGYNFFYWWWGSFTIFWVGGGGEKYVPPDPPQLILEQL